MEQIRASENKESSHQLQGQGILLQPQDCEIFERFFSSPCSDSAIETSKDTAINNNLSSVVAVNQEATIPLVTKNTKDDVSFNSFRQEPPSSKLLVNYNNESSSDTVNVAFVEDENQQLGNRNVALVPGGQQQLLLGGGDELYDDIFFNFRDLFPDGLDLALDFDTEAAASAAYNNIDQKEITNHTASTVGFMANRFDNLINHSYRHQEQQYMPLPVHLAPPPQLAQLGNFRKGRRRRGRKRIFSKEQQRINNRISAARSIAKKQAYVKNLEREVIRLRSEIGIKRKLLRFLESSLEIPLNKRSLGRTVSAPLSFGRQQREGGT